MAERRATMKDVAQASGVSTATVSFILNNSPGQSFSEATRDRVVATAAALGYQAHGLARALREGHSRVVLLDVSGLRPGRSLQAYIRGLTDELRRHELSLLVLPDADAEDTRTEIVRVTRPFAVLDLADTYADPAIASDGGWTSGLASHTLLQFQHLAKKGHSYLAFAIPDIPDDDGLAARRWDIAREVCTRLALPDPVLFRTSTAGSATAALEQLRLSHPDVTAVAGFDDLTALRVLAAMAELGMSAPADLAVIGFDDSEAGTLWRPALSTVWIDAESFGRRTARAVVRDESNEPFTPARILQRQTT